MKETRYHHSRHDTPHLRFVDGFTYSTYHVLHPAVEKLHTTQVILEKTARHLWSMALSVAELPAMMLATTWLPDPTGKAKPLRASRKCFNPQRSSHSRRIALSYSVRTDMDNVIKIQAGYKAQPLSAYLKQPTAACRASRGLPQDQ